MAPTAFISLISLHYSIGGGATADSGSRCATLDVPISRSCRITFILIGSVQDLMALGYIIKMHTGNSSSVFPSIKKHMSITRVRT